MLDLKLFEESPHLLDLLMQMEDVLDSLDIYVFKNWFKGEVADGPAVHRYWLAMTLQWPLEKMPDPRGAKRLLRHDILCEYSKATVTDADPSKLPADQKEEAEKPTHWMVEIKIPRRLIADMNAAELDMYDDDLDVEDVQAAQDSGITDENSFETDNPMNTNQGQASDGAGGDQGFPEEEFGAPK
jgi:hypothetical protein